jgi:hypothetical protein
MQPEKIWTQQQCRGSQKLPQPASCLGQLQEPSKQQLQVQHPQQQVQQQYDARTHIYSLLLPAISLTTSCNSDNSCN